MDIDCILVHLYGIIGLHLRVRKREGNAGDDKNIFPNLGIEIRGVLHGP